MMEKVTIIISKGQHACNEPEQGQHVSFLQAALQISRRRACRINDALSKQCGAYSKLTIDVDYKQLGAYTALRRKPVELMKVWKHPEIVAHEFGCPPPRPCDQPIELRPTHRRIP